MLSWLMRRRIDAFQAEYGYDASYVRTILNVSPKALWLWARVGRLSTFRDGLPLAAFYAAQLVGTLSEDCGPCAQLVSTMAERAGIEAGLIRSIVMRDFSAMPSEVALIVRFSEAVLQRRAEADELRPKVVARFGEKGLVCCAFALTSARLYPTVKYALGYGKTCTRISVGGEFVPRLKEAV